MKRCIVALALTFALAGCGQVFACGDAVGPYPAHFGGASCGVASHMANTR